MKDFLQAIVFIGLFAVPFLPIYVENDFFFPFITGKNFAFRIIVEIMFASWILLAMYDKAYRPRFSWILAGFSALLAVMLAANALGEYPLKSFWSNFERMDGYVTLVHLFLYVVVLGSVVKTEKMWNYLLHTTVAVALFVAIFGLMQMSGMVEGGRARLDSKLGNAAYMAVYMLFHIFIVFYLFVRSKLTMHRFLYALVAIIFIYTLLLTGTRGTFLGFLGGGFVTVAYIALFGSKYPQFRKFAAAGLVGLTLVVGGFYAMKDSQFVQDSTSLKRIANIDIAQDLETRGVIWGMALEGVKERPLLGWGQGNFNYVFNEQFEPYLWNKEAWFDRVHNIFLDWLIAGGVFGLLAYLSIFLAAFYYLFWQPMRTSSEDHAFNVLERGVLIGLLVGYFLHNLVVFDNIISYIFFALVLALIHSRASVEWPSVQNWKIDDRIVTQFAAPIVLIITAAIVYFANVPGLQATGDIIDALREQTVEGRLEQFDEALSRDSFANQEIVEQLAQNAINLARNQDIPAAEREAFVNRAEQELIKLTEEKPGDARLHTFFATFYRSTNQIDKAREQAAIARSLSPQKQAIITEQAIVELQAGKPEEALGFLQTAFELEESNTPARILYAATLVQVGRTDEAKELIGEEYLDEFASDNYAVSIVQQSGEIEFLIELFEKKVEMNPNNIQNRASLSFLYYQNEQPEDSIAVLEQAAVDLPEFEERAQCIIGNIESGKSPDTGC